MPKYRYFGCDPIGQDLILMISDLDIKVVGAAVEIIEMNFISPVDIANYHAILD